MVPVEIQKHFEIGTRHAQAIVGFASSTQRTRRFNGDRSRRQFLRNEDGKTLRATLGPIIDARQHRILIIKIVVEHRDERRAKAHILLKRPCALHLKRDFRHAVREQNVRAIRFFRLRGPFVADRSAVGLQG